MRYPLTPISDKRTGQKVNNIFFLIPDFNSVINGMILFCFFLFVVVVVSFQVQILSYKMDQDLHLKYVLKFLAKIPKLNVLIKRLL